MSSEPEDSDDEDIPTYEIDITGSTDGGDRVPDLSPREALERWLNKLRVSKSESTSRHTTIDSSTSLSGARRQESIQSVR